jgi:hypothetical protein
MSDDFFDFFEKVQEKKEIRTWDAVIMNPPYRGSQNAIHKNKRMGKNNSIWEKFVDIAFNSITKDNGIIAAIHPPRWRKPTDELWNILKKKQFFYLSIHNKDDGLETFGGGCDQRYDWYVAKNASVNMPTIVKWEDGEESDVDFTKTAIIPNFLYNKVFKMLAKPNEEKVNILHSFSLYYSRPNASGEGKPWMSSTKTDSHIYPCVWSIDYKGNPKLHYSSKKGEYFGIPKLIFASGRVSSANYLIDAKGEYGMTQFAKGIVDRPENLPKIYKAMMTKEFKDIMDACSLSTHEIDKDILALFRKDFWKEFI